jgi:hypothetical protein
MKLQVSAFGHHPIVSGPFHGFTKLRNGVLHYCHIGQRPGYGGISHILFINISESLELCSCIIKTQCTPGQTMFRVLQVRK